MHRYVGNSSNIPWNKIHRWTNDNDGTFRPPHYTLYTRYNLLDHFYGFCGILLMQSICVYIAKLKFSPAFRKSSWLEKIIHSVENIHIPYNFEEWDTENSGSVVKHIQRMKRNAKEVVSVMIINFLFNCILLIPLGNLGN